MFCHECDYALATGERYVHILFGSGREVVCLNCALTLDWHSHGQPVYVHGQECHFCGEPSCHDCGGLDRREEAEMLCRKYNRATNPFNLHSDHEHCRNAQLARAIRHRLARIGARYRETESGRLVAS